MKQIIYAKVVYCSLIKHHIFFAPSFYWNIQFLHFPSKGVHSRWYFPAKYLSYFLSWIAHNLSSVWWISWKMHPVNVKKLSYLISQASILRSTGLSVKEISKKLKKSERLVVKWSSRNDGFEDKKITGRPKILNEAAKRILNKAKYKRGNSTRQLSQQLASKGHVGGKTPSGGLWKAKVGDRWEGKGNFCSLPSSVQIDWKLLRSTKTSLRKNGVILSQIFVSAAQSKKWYCLGFSGEPSSSSVSG